MVALAEGPTSTSQGQGLVYEVTNLSTSSWGTTGQGKHLPFQLSQIFFQLVNDSQVSWSELQFKFGLFFVKALPLQQRPGLGHGTLHAPFWDSFILYKCRFQL